jgi:hypothetical protein
MNRISFLAKRILYKGKDGIPYIRDFNSPCFAYEPTNNPFKRGDCQTDGHYLCGGCQWRELAFDCPTDCRHLCVTGDCTSSKVMPRGARVTIDSTLPVCPYYESDINN